jgi:hypothetical protein
VHMVLLGAIWSFGNGVLVFDFLGEGRSFGGSRGEVGKTVAKEFWDRTFRTQHSLWARHDKTWTLIRRKLGASNRQRTLGMQRNQQHLLLTLFYSFNNIYLWGLSASSTILDSHPRRLSFTLLHTLAIIIFTTWGS